MRKRQGLNFYETLVETTPNMKSPTELVAEADDLQRQLKAVLDDSETLSKKQYDLALVNTGLGNLLIEALDGERDAETEYKYEVNKRKLDIMATERDEKDKLVSATYAESKAEYELHEKKLDWNKWKHNVTVFKIKREDISKVLDQGRTRVSLIKGDIKNESF